MYNFNVYNIRGDWHDNNNKSQSGSVQHTAKKPQKSIDFERFLKGSGNSEDRLLQLHFDSVIEGLEKTKNVIFQIFGEEK